MSAYIGLEDDGYSNEMAQDESTGCFRCAGNGKGMRMQTVKANPSRRKGQRWSSKQPQYSVNKASPAQPTTRIVGDPTSLDAIWRR
ncbi:hypothetical protein VKT23_011095 [Stygiomarasmius scandens]|uniref:Uncharacterized protein n=1 Tax=Marasmiellus scandens TaxID=2682957 RepID=A0ABR1JFH8_9AGAR